VHRQRIALWVILLVLAMQHTYIQFILNIDLTKIGGKSSLLDDSYIVCQELESHDQESWMGCIKELFNYLNLQSIYKNCNILTYNLY
jgi:hypothetical protein